jgi:hypothetical protein
MSLEEFVVKRKNKDVLDFLSSHWVDKASEFNTFSSSVSVLPLAASIPINNTITLNAHYQMVANQSLDVNKNALTLLLKGNTSFLDQNVALENNLTAAIRSEIGIGATYRNDNLALGFRIKSQSGVAGIFTDKNKLNLRTDAKNYGLSLDNDYRLLTFKAQSLIFNNNGISFDLGAKYQLDNLNLSMSIIDFLGGMKFKTEGTAYESKGKFDFYGFPAFETRNVTFETFVDSMEKAVKLVTTDAPNYKYKMNPRINMSASYQLSPMFQMGVGFFMEPSPEEFRFAAITNLGVNIKDIYYIGITAGQDNNFDAHLGFHTSVKIARKLQLYFVTDDVMSYPFPNLGKSFNGRLGINIIFDTESKKELKDQERREKFDRRRKQGIRKEKKG